MSRNANAQTHDLGAAAKLKYLLGSKCRISNAVRAAKQDPSRTVATDRRGVAP